MVIRKSSIYKNEDFYVALILVVIGLSTLCYIHHLNWIYCIMLIGSCIYLLPLMLQAYYKYKKEKKRFDQYCLYFENMKLYYKVHHKLIIALVETQKVFSEKDKMYKCIKLAIDELRSTADYQRALVNIENYVKNLYLLRFHALLINGEKHGGDVIYYNLDHIDFTTFKDDMKAYQQRKKGYRMTLYVLTVLAFVLSVSIIYMFQDYFMTALFLNAQYQLFTYIELQLLIFIFVIVYRSLVVESWIKEDE